MIPNHYVSAKDMAIISAEAYKYEAFRNMIRTQQYTIPPTNLVGEQRIFQQNHKMIYEGNQYYYDACTSGKTGYTDEARTTLVSYAEKNGMQTCLCGATHKRRCCVHGYTGVI